MMRKVSFRDIKEYVSRKGRTSTSQETTGKCAEIANNDNDNENDEQEEETVAIHGHEKWAKGASAARKVSLKSSRFGILSRIRGIRRKMSRSDAISSAESEDCYSFVPSTHKQRTSCASAPLQLKEDHSAHVGCRRTSTSADAIDGTNDAKTYIQVYQDPEVVIEQDASWHSQSSGSDEEVPEIPVRPVETLRDNCSATRDTSVYSMLNPTDANSPCRSLHSLTEELLILSKHGWYWGPISRREAEQKLADQSDGSFLVRDSSDDRYLLSLSFRSYGRTLHTRIERCNGLFSFYLQPEHEGLASIVDLIQNSMASSQTAVFCYSRARVPGAPSFPVRLMKPVSRFTQVRTLQYLCRFVIRQNTRLDHIQKLPLPNRIKGYIEEGHY